jgi:hypothetical protein
MPFPDHFSLFLDTVVHSITAASESSVSLQYTHAHHSRFESLTAKMSESPNAVACPECSSLEQTIEPDIPTAISEGQVVTETCQQTEVCLRILCFLDGKDLMLTFHSLQTPTPTSQAVGDAEKIAASIEAQREAEAHGSREEVRSVEQFDQQKHY